MGIFFKDIKTMDDLFVHTLRDIYYAENRIVKSLPDMVAKATDKTLKAGFDKHLAETKNQVKRLEQVFAQHGVEAKQVKCPAIDGILQEADEVAGEVDDKRVLDAALIAAARRWSITRSPVMARLCHGRSFLAMMIARLQQNLDEEKATDSKLTSMAEQNVNQMAA